MCPARTSRCDERDLRVGRAADHLVDRGLLRPSVDEEVEGGRRSSGVRGLHGGDQWRTSVPLPPESVITGVAGIGMSSEVEIGADWLPAPSTANTATEWTLPIVADRTVSDVCGLDPAGGDRLGRAR